MERKLKPAYTRTRIVTHTPDDQKSKVIQSEKRNADINHIVSKAFQTGQLPVLMGREPIPNLPTQQTYQEMLNTVVYAQQTFERLPVQIRNEFENKPEKMLAAIEHSKKSPELKARLQEIGILETPLPIVDPKPDLSPQSPVTE